MKNAVPFLIALALAATGAHAAPKPSNAPAIVAALDRTISGGRDVRVSLPQSEIRVGVDVGRVAASMGGDSLMGALIIGELDRDRREVMEKEQDRAATAKAEPLRTVLKGVDVEALAMATTKSALSRVDWFQAQNVTLTKSEAPQMRADFINASTTPQVAVVDYGYEMSPDFSHLRVNVWISMARKGARRNAANQPIYTQNMSSVVQLKTRSYEHSENIKSWSADDGKLLKSALVAAFSQFERMIPYALGLSAEDAKALTAKDREKAYAAGLYGPLVERGNGQADDVLIWARGFINVQTAR